MHNSVRTYVPKSILLIIGVILFFSFILSCASMQPKPDIYPKKGDPHTLTYTDSSGKEVTVFDLTGMWSALYYGRQEFINIIQKEDRFEGYKTLGNQYLTSGQITISGKIIGNKVSCQTYDSGGKRISGVNRISEKVEKFTCPSNYEGFRIFSRIE